MAGHALCFAKPHHLVRVGRDQDFVKRGACARSFVHPGDHRSTGYLAQDLMG